MKSLNKWGLIIAVFLLCSGVYGVSGQETATETETEAATEEVVEIPDSTEMTLGVKDDKNVMPEGFRGSNPDSGDIHWLEDVGYLMQENSNLYNYDADEIAANAKFEGPPNINWEISKEEDDGSMKTEQSTNTNEATEKCNITSPGYYEVHNGGARQVSTSGGAEGEDAVGDAGSAPEGSEGGEDGEEAKEGEDAAKTVTAQQRVGIHVHDCTSPDLWVAFQEGAGTVNMAETEDALKKQMAEKIVANLGRPFSTKADDYEDASYIFLEEGKDDERNSIPWEKTARLSIAGTLFNERGAPKFESGKLPSQIDAEDFKNAVTVVGGEEKSLKGVFVRRNVPFIFAAMSTDNGNNRATLVGVTANIVDADGKEVEKDGDSYLFRVPNYPREKYEDQPEYFFTALSTDKDGNSTSVKMPLYIVDTMAAFEGSHNR